MSQAQIGNLQVALGINTAQFAAGLSQAQGSLARFGAGLKAFAGMAAGSLSLGAIGMALKSSIDHMDELGKTAQKIGIPVEELSKLELAAKLSDVSLEDLTTTLAKFSKNISEIGAGGQNDAGQALKALGISAVDAQGKLRPTTAIIGDIADEFSTMQDGAGKTALAIALFGKSGAQMIPLLNGGRDALKEAAAQAQAFGTVVSEQAAAAAENLNDNLTRMQEVTNGVFQQIAIGLLPAIVKVTDAIVTYSEKGDIANTVSDAMSWVMKEVAKAAVSLNREISELTTMVNFLATATDLVKNGDFAGVATAWGEAAAQNRKNLADFAKELERIDSATQETAPGKGDRPSNRRTKPAPIIPDLAAAKAAANEAAQALQRLKDEGQSLWEQTRTPLESYQLGIRHLNDLLQAGVISHDTYDRAVKQLQDEFSQAAPAADEFRNSLEDIGQTISDSLGNAFEGLISGTMSVKDAFKSMVQSITQMLAQLARQLIMSAIFKLLAAAFGGSVAPSPQTFLGSLFTPRALGGPVSLGKSYMVGENGPELFTPGSSGYITPNNKLGSGQAPQMNVTVINNSSASVSTRKGANGGLEVMVEEMIADKLLRGGNKIDSALARGYGLRRAGR